MPHLTDVRQMALTEERHCHSLLCRSVIGRTLMRENLKLGRKQWKLQRQLAPLGGKREPDWSSSRTKSSDGSIEVPSTCETYMYTKNVQNLKGLNNDSLMREYAAV